MKNKSVILMLAIMAAVLYGCPVGLDFPLGEEGKEKIDATLTGEWYTENTEAEVQKLRIEKKDDFRYQVTVTEKGTMYEPSSDVLTGWITTLEGQKFLCLKPDGEGKTYHYAYKKGQGESVVTYGLALLEGGIDVVTSTEKLREEVRKSMKKAEFYQDSVIWEKF